MRAVLVAARRAELRREGKDDHLDYRWVPYERISNNLKRAMVAAEDAMESAWS